MPTPPKQANLKRAIWFWHFWVGVLMAPVLIVTATTGAIYIFKPELELWWYADIASSKQVSSSLPKLDRLMKLAADSLDQDWKATGLELESGTHRLPAILFERQSHGHGFKRLYVDPDQQVVRGEIPANNLFRVVLDLHRRLMIGIPGRLIVELITTWTMLMGITGLVLWWPKTWKSMQGVFLVRWNRKAYVMMRDLHAILGSFSSLAMMLIAFTGLSYSYVWGFAYHATAMLSGQYAFMDFEKPPKPATAPIVSTPSVSLVLPPITVDDALEIAQRENIPLDRISVGLPEQPDGYYSIEAGGVWGPSVQKIVRIDAVDGKVLQMMEVGDLPPMAWWTQWNYPLHVGSFGGLATKILWLIACMVMVGLPISGITMYVLRKRRDTWSLPNQIPFPSTRLVKATVVLLCIFLPLAGLSILVAITAVWFVPPKRR
jgi:uncharacterized iron-regulated membrane protein